MIPTFISISITNTQTTQKQNDAEKKNTGLRVTVIAVHPFSQFQLLRARFFCPHTSKGEKSFL